MTIWHMPIACWITKAAETHSECVIFIAYLVLVIIISWYVRLKYTYEVCPKSNASDLK